MTASATADPVLRIVDAQAGGDISRVIIAGAPRLAGDSIAAQCADFARRYDHLRLKLIHPPHGELHMCPVLLRPPCAKDADFGVIIMESMGYPPISGSNLFCAAAVALQYGFATMSEPETRLTVETPAGLVAITARCRDRRCESVEFENSPSCIKSTITVSLGPLLRTVPVTVVSAGVDYAVVDASDVNVELLPGSHEILVALGQQITAQAGTDFVLFHDRLQRRHGGAECRVAVFQNPAVICRSPTGTGTSALITLAYSRGLLPKGETLTASSPAGSSFHGRIRAVQDTAAGPVLNTVVSGDVAIDRELEII